MALRNPPTLAPFVIAALLLGACTQKTIDHKDLEEQIQQGMASKGVPLTKVSCPDGEVMTKGTKFTCSGVDKNGTTGLFDITTDSAGDLGWKLRGKYVNMMVVGDRLEADLSKKLHQAVDVVCPSESVIIKKGLTFTCDVKVGAEMDKITLVVNDENGDDVDYHLRRKH
jgi:hypothetical protein